MDPWKLPTSLDVNGKEYSIRSDFRVILDILSAMNDPDIFEPGMTEEEKQQEKTLTMLRILYVDFDSMPPKDWQEACKYNGDLCITLNNVSLDKASAYLKKGGIIKVFGDGSLGSYFGDAMPEDVRKGKRFTSKDGVAAGTMEVDSGGSGVQVKTGTTSSPTINTGLSKIDKMIIYADKITSVGVVTAVYSADAGKAKVIFCGDYSVYSKACGITDRSGFSVSGGTFSWTESTKEYKFMNNATYNWIAIGS